MTDYERTLLASIGNGRFLYGSAELRGARRLELRGLVTLEDNGDCKLGRHVDRERWFAKAVTS